MTEPSVSYTIETRSLAAGGAWSSEGIGDANEFASPGEAAAAVALLQAMGPDWAATEYRVVDGGGNVEGEFPPLPSERAIRQGLHAAGLDVEGLAVASDEAHDHVGPVLVTSQWVGDDGNAACNCAGTTAAEAAASYVGDGSDWGDGSPCLATWWISVQVWRQGWALEEGELVSVRVDEDEIKVQVDAKEPTCEPGCSHEWAAPHALVGGLAENPGVHGHGGGVVSSDLCMVCGCGRSHDSWAQDPTDGAEMLGAVKYSPGEYSADDLERARLASDN